MSSEPAITVRNISKVYDLGLSGRANSWSTLIKARLRHPIRGLDFEREKFHALDDISFDVQRGEVVGLIGRNGAGKSTLLKILSRITRPSAGYVEMTGTVGSLLEVGTGFHPELTGIENVYMNGTILGMTKREIDRRLDEIVDFAEVDKFLDTPVKRYSSGMRVRLAFAVAAHLDPDVMIIDEVLSVGDQAFQVKCLDKMRAIATEEGRTVFYVSHNLVSVENLCPRSLLLVDGRLAFDGETKETLAEYLGRFPAARHGGVSGVFDLTDVERPKDRTKVFSRVELRPGGGTPSDTIRMGDRLQIEVHVRGYAEVNRPLVQVSVGSTVNPTIFRMRSNMKPVNESHPRCDDEKIVIDIPSLTLVPGEYLVTLVLRDGSHAHIDEVSRAAEFTVIPADLLGHGYQYHPADGFVMVPWEWELRPDDAALVAVDSEAEAV